MNTSAITYRIFPNYKIWRHSTFGILRYLGYIFWIIRYLGYPFWNLRFLGYIYIYIHVDRKKKEKPTTFCHLPSASFLTLWVQLRAGCFALRCGTQISIWGNNRPIIDEWADQWADWRADQQVIVVIPGQQEVQGWYLCRCRLKNGLCKLIDWLRF